MKFTSFLTATTFSLLTSNAICASLPWLGAYGNYKILTSGNIVASTTFSSGGPVFANGACSFSSLGSAFNSYGSPNCISAQIPGLQCANASFVAPAAQDSNIVDGTLIAKTINGLQYVDLATACAPQLVTIVSGLIAPIITSASTNFQNAPGQKSITVTNAGPNSISLTEQLYDVLNMTFADTYPINTSVNITANYIPGKKIIVNIGGTNVSIESLSFPGVGSNDLLLNFYAATTLNINLLEDDIQGSILAPLAIVTFSSPSTFEIEGQLIADSIVSGVTCGVANNNYFDFDFGVFNAVANIGCASQFIPTEDTMIPFTNGANVLFTYKMPAANTTIQYMPYLGDPLGKVVINSNLTFVSSPAGNYTAPKLTLSFVLINNGPKLGSNPTPFFYSQVRADWMYYAIVTANSTLTNPADNSHFLLAQPTGSQPQYLQIGTGANGTPTVYGMAFAFSWGYPFTGKYYNVATISTTIADKCTCTNQVQVNNFGANPDNYVVNFPVRYSRDPMKAYNFLADGITISGFSAGPYNVTNIAGQLLHLYGYITPQNITTTESLYLDIWLQGVSTPFTACQQALNTAGYSIYDWQFYQIVHGTMDIFNETTGTTLYDIYQQSTTYFNPYVCAVGELNPFVQIGIGANDQTDDYGIFIPAMYQARTTTAYAIIDMLGTLTNANSTCAVQPL